MLSIEEVLERKEKDYMLNGKSVTLAITAE